MLDLELVDRRVARNLDYALARFGEDLRAENLRQLRRWATNVIRSGR